jgi:CheY-like chemotaxis protein
MSDRNEAGFGLIGPELQGELAALGADFSEAPTLAQWQAFLERVQALYDRQQLSLGPLTHELKTPMTVVLGAAELLLESSLDPNQRNTAQAIHRSGKELLKVIDQLITEEYGKSQPPQQSGTYPEVRIDERAKERRVLLAEDNEFNRVFMIRALAALGCRVDTALTGREAVLMAGEIEYDLVIMDCQMPELDGLAATREIRAAERIRRVPIVACSASSLSGERRRCIDAGMDDFIAKPFTLDKLRGKVLHWLMSGPRPVVHSAGLPESGTMRASRAIPADEGELPPVNMSRLLELSEEAGSPSIVVELSLIFVDDIRRRLAALAESLSGENKQAFFATVHSVRGACANFGAQRMANMAESLERSALEGDFSGAEAAVQQLRQEFEVVRAVLQTEILDRDPRRDSDEPEPDGLRKAKA